MATAGMSTEPHMVLSSSFVILIAPFLGRRWKYRAYAHVVGSGITCSSGLFYCLSGDAYYEIPAGQLPYLSGVRILLTYMDTVGPGLQRHIDVVVDYEWYTKAMAQVPQLHSFL